MENIPVFVQLVVSVVAVLLAVIINTKLGKVLQKRNTTLIKPEIIQYILIGIIAFTLSKDLGNINFNRYTDLPKLNRIKKQDDNLKATFHDTWEIQPKIDLKLFNNSRKVWIMGKFKVGKSTILNYLGVKQSVGDPLVNTNGEVFLTDDSWKNTIFVDTEGFEQSINIDDPELRMNLIINHAILCADQIIIVVPMMTSTDTKLMLKIIQNLRYKNFQLLIVHNLKTLTSQDHIVEYMKRMNAFFHSQQYQTVIELDNYMITIIHQGFSITNYFLGRSAELNNLNKIVIRQLKNKIENGIIQGKSLHDTLIESFKTTYFWAYNVISGAPTVQITNNNFIVSAKINGKRELKLGDNIIVGVGINYRWQSPYKINKSYYQNLLLDSTGIDVNSIVLEIKDDRRISVEFNSSKLNDDMSFNTIIGRRELVLCENNLVAAEKNARKALKNKILLKTHEILFQFELGLNNPITELLRSENENLIKNLNNLKKTEHNEKDN